MRITANKITAARLTCGVGAGCCLFTCTGNRLLFAFVSFLIAFVLDKVDGTVARRNAPLTIAGRWWDSVTDQIVLFINLLALASRQVVPIWLVTLVILRELLLQSLWDFSHEIQLDLRIFKAWHLRYALQSLAVLTGILGLTGGMRPGGLTIPRYIPLYLLSAGVCIGVVTLLLTVFANRNRLLQSRSIVKDRPLEGSIVRPTGANLHGDFERLASGYDRLLDLDRPDTALQP